jgi:cardiolipin synthase
MKRLATVLLPLFMLVATACGGATPAHDSSDSEESDLSARGCTPTSRRAHALVLNVEPDDASGPWTAAMSNVKTSIRVLIYQMGAGPILDGLIAAAHAGRDVRVIMDKSQEPVNTKYMTLLTAAGAKVIWSDPQFSFMHAKVMIVDDDVAVVSTGNYAATQLATERNYVMTDIDAKDVASLATLFEADFARTAPDLTCTRLLVSPINSRDRIIEVIKGAQNELLVESMQFADAAVREAVVERKNAGVKVRVIVADPSWIAANTAAGQYLKQNGIEGRRMLAPKVHVKSIIVDGTHAYAGSENLSSTSLDHNREVGLVVTEAANVSKMHETFETDWATATAF